MNCCIKCRRLAVGAHSQQNGRNEPKIINTVISSEKPNEGIAAEPRTVSQNVPKPQSKMKGVYDDNASVRTLQPSNMALSLLSSGANKSLPIWQGGTELGRLVNNRDIMLNGRKSKLNMDSRLRYGERNKPDDDGTHCVKMTFMEESKNDGHTIVTGDMETDDGLQPRYTPGKFKLRDDWTTEQQHAKRRQCARDEFGAGSLLMTDNEYRLVLPNSRQNEIIRITQGSPCGGCFCEDIM